MSLSPLVSKKSSSKRPEWFLSLGKRNSIRPLFQNPFKISSFESIVPRAVISSRPPSEAAESPKGIKNKFKNINTFFIKLSS